MRGEKLCYGLEWKRFGGSPPHARGKVIITDFFTGFPGITPACAGKSFFLLSYLLDCKDHPRMRGEKTKKIPI